MLSVAVCDDNKIFLTDFRDMLETYTQVSEVDVYSDYDSLKHSVTDKKVYDIIFMDIDFGDSKTGIDFASELYNISPKSKIIYVTCHRDRYAQQVFLEKSNLHGYLLKPIDANLLKRYLNKAIRDSEKRSFLTITVKGKQIHLSCDEILWLESHNHTTTVCLENDKHIVYEKLIFILERLPRQFVQSHKSYVVNMDMISVLEGNSVFLNGGIKIPVSRSYRKSMNDSFFTFIGENI